MALDAAVYPQDPFSNYSLGNWNSDDFPFPFHGDDILENNSNTSNSSVVPANWDSSNINSSFGLVQNHPQWDPNNSSPETCNADQSLPAVVFDAEILPLGDTSGRRKRRRTKSAKNKEEIESQRMTHIAVERNRRKLMNEYLALLRSLMPPSYVQRGDQASIVGGAINFVKELEQLMQTMQGQKKTNHQPDSAATGSLSSPFANFFSFPQYSTRTPATGDEISADRSQSEWGTADIEVTMVESHANVKILSKRRPKQLLKMVAGLQALRLSVLHLNVTTVHQMVLYSVSIKVEEECHLNTVDEMAAAVNQLLHRIHEEESVFG